MAETRSALTGCLQQEAAAIADTASRLSAEQVEEALRLLQHCSDQGRKLVISGVGKSGIVARKIAATFSSICLTSIYLNPLDALHGDLGVVVPDDVVLLLSNSGETEELVQLLPHLKRRGVPTIALVGRLQSTLARACDVVLDGSVDREVCPINLAPTASTAVAMAIGDALASVWMERAEVSSQDFALNHPAGALGKKLTLTAADLMVPVANLKALSPAAPLQEVITSLTDAGVGASWVASPHQPNKLIGLITDGDLRRALQDSDSEAWRRLCASDLMTSDPITVKEDALAIDAMELMERNSLKEISVLPVVQHSGAFLGLLRLHDLVQAGLS